MSQKKQYNRNDIPFQEYDRVVQENNALQEKITYLNNIIDELRKKVKELTPDTDHEYILGCRMFREHDEEREETY